MGDAIISVSSERGLVPSTYMMTTRGRKTGRPVTHPATVSRNRGGAGSWRPTERCRGCTTRALPDE